VRQQRCRLRSRKRASGSARASKLAHKEKVVAPLPQPKPAILAVSGDMGRMPMPQRLNVPHPIEPEVSIRLKSGSSGTAVQIGHLGRLSVMGGMPVQL